MTRETKIGLLVGLAFIIVIGILLSDYNRNESQAAALNAVAGDVQKGAATPHNGSTDSAVVPPATAPHVPARTVPTHDELHPPATPAPIAVPVVRAPAPDAGAHPSASPGPVAAAPPHAAPGHGAIAVPPGVGRLLDEHPDDLAAVGPAAPPVATPAPPRNPAPPAGVTVNGAKPYVALTGDTVSKMAGRFLGGNTKANREAILAINPVLKQNPNNVTVGKTYMIPPKAAAAGATAPVRAVAAAPAPAPASEQHYFYVVKDNDSLWRIASEQLGDAGSIDTLKELNKDILKGSDVLHPNMRLRLPSKPVASVN